MLEMLCELHDARSTLRETTKRMQFEKTSVQVNSEFENIENSKAIDSRIKVEFNSNSSSEIQTLESISGVYQTSSQSLNIWVVDYSAVQLEGLTLKF